VNIDEVTLNFNPTSLLALDVVLALIMFGIALAVKVEDFKAVLRMPKAITVAIAAQFLLLPAVTFGLTFLLNVGPSIALGMILVACCPPGNISQVLTNQARGNVALSVSMTAVGNLLAIFLMPINFAFWGSLRHAGEDRGDHRAAVCPRHPDR
jgi:BASS family bile acid:Na+ symporter